MHGDTQHNAKYNSQELDTETGYYFYNARHYDPVICRFVTADSVVDGELSPMGWNRYMYVHGNPIVYLDPTGHATDYQQIQEDATSWQRSPATSKETFNNAMRNWIAQEHIGVDMEVTKPDGMDKWEYNRRRACIRNGNEVGLSVDKDKWKDFDAKYRHKIALIEDARTKMSVCVQIKNWLENLETAGRPMPSMEEINERALSGVKARNVFGVVVGAIVGVGQSGGFVSNAPKNKTQSSKIDTPTTENTTGYRYMTQGEIDAIKQSGKLRGGNPGETFFTKDLYKSAQKAKSRLALPSKPTHRVEFEIRNNPTLIRNGTKVKRAFGERGGGSEFMTTDPVKVQIKNIQPLR